MYNRLTGTVPSALGRLLHLDTLRLEHNLLSGQVPSSLGLCTRLIQLTLQNNRFDGSIPSAVLALPSLSKLLLAQNRLTGVLNLSSADALQLATLFGNRFGGALVLPLSGSLFFLMAHSNLFSGEISGRVRVHPDPRYAHSLAAPGNQLQAEPARYTLEVPHGPSWETAHNATFLWVGSPLQNWGQELIVCVVGGALMLLCVATTGVVLVAVTPAEDHSTPFASSTTQQHGCRAMRTRLWRFVSFVPKRRIALAQVWCARRLALLAVATCSVLIPTFTLGATLYKSGDPLIKYCTIAYIAESPGCEWCAAAATCVFYCVSVWLVLQFQQMLRESYASCLEEPPPVVSMASIASMYLRWTLLMVLCTVIGVAYAFSVSVPPDTIAGDVPPWLLTAVGEGSSFALAFTTAVVIPACCRTMTHRVFGVGGHPVLTSRLMQIARLWTSIVAPALALVLILEDCLGGWKSGWKPCSRGAFDIADDGDEDDLPLLVTNRDVCSLRYVPGRCSRAVVQQLGRLLLSKLAYASFLLPVGVLMLHSPSWRRVKEAIVRRFKSVYMASFDVDAEFTGRSCATTATRCSVHECFCRPCPPAHSLGAWRVLTTFRGTHVLGAQRTEYSCAVLPLRACHTNLPTDTALSTKFPK